MSRTSQLNIVPFFGPRRPRDQRLDFWRGLCLIDMLLVHLAYQNVQFGDFLGKAIGSYTRFAAGGFIFISGMSVGIIFLPRALDPVRRLGTYGGLLRRSLYILVFQYVAALGLILLDRLQGTSSFAHASSPLAIMRDVLLLREGGDLLPFYVIMILLSPLLLEVIRRRGGWAVLAAASVGLFIWGQYHPWAFAPAAHLSFPPVLWQGIFIAGLIFAYFFRRYDALRRRWKLLTAAIAWSVFGLLFVSEYSSDFGLPHLNLYMSFAKVPLSDGEALRYLSMIVGIIVVTDLAWPLLVGTSGSEFVQTLGRKSLPVYVAHLWLTSGVGALAMTWWWMGPWQIILAVVSVLLLWMFALVLDVSGAPRPRRAAWGEAMAEPAQ